MHINPCLFILARPPHQVVWNYEQHTQFELELDYSTRLAKLIQDPSRFDIHNAIDVDLLNADIIIEKEREPAHWKWDELSRIFHLGTKNIPYANIPQDVNEWANLYLQHCDEVLSSPRPPARIKHDSATRVALSPPLLVDLQDASLARALIDRKTSRSFHEQPISIEQVSTLLYLTLGYLNERQGAREGACPESLGARRSSPSGGGLNACEGYLYVRNVTGLTPGLYAYHPDEHTLSLVGPLPDAPLGRMLCGQHFINPLPFGLFITSRFDKLWWKYEHSRAYRMAFVETGHVSQTFLMVATALGLDTWLTGALSDQEVERLLGLEDSCEQPLFFVGCGHGDGQVHCKELMALIERQDAAS